MLSAYPLLFAFAGFVASAWFYRRALSLMDADAKAALVDTSSRTNLLNLVIVAVFCAFVFWRPLFAWIFLICAYLGLGARSVIRLRRLNLPMPAGRNLLMGNWSAVLGIALCALIFAHRAMS